MCKLTCVNEFIYFFFDEVWANGIIPRKMTLKRIVKSIILINFFYKYFLKLFVYISDSLLSFVM